MGVIGQALGQQQQIKPLRQGLGLAQLPLEQPRAGGKFKAAGEPGIHKHPQGAELQQPAVGPEKGGMHGRIACGRRTLNSEPPQQQQVGAGPHQREHRQTDAEGAVGEGHDPRLTGQRAIAGRASTAAINRHPNAVLEYRQDAGERQCCG
jgi:hypothetical protein